MSCGRPGHSTGDYLRSEDLQPDDLCRHEFTVVMGIDMAQGPIVQNLVRGYLVCRFCLVLRTVEFTR